MTDTKAVAVPERRDVAIVGPVDWMALAANLPEPDDDVTSRIAATILASERPEDMNAPYAQEGMRNLFGVPLRVWAVRKGESQFTEGQPIFLIAEAHRMDTGEAIVTTTSAEAAMAVLIKAVLSDWLPIDVMPTPAKKPTKAGFIPYHLEVLGRPATDSAGEPF